MTRHVLFAALAFLATGTMATGTMAAGANGAGDNAVIIAVSNVRFPDRLPGTCLVTGIVDEVLGGKAFRDGQAVSLRVPCGRHSRPEPLLPAVEEYHAQPIDPAVLAGSRLGGAHIDDAGRLLWEPTRPYGRWGAVWGFRIFEAVPLNQRHAS